MLTIKFLFRYCFTKRIIIIFSILNIILFILFLLSIVNINEMLSYSEVLENYAYNSVYYSKIVIVLLSSYLFMNIMNNKTLFALNFIVSSGNKKRSYLDCLIIINIFLIFCFALITFILYMLVGFFTKKYFSISYSIIIDFCFIFVQSIYYGLLSLLLIEILNNSVGFIFSFLLFILSELITNKENIVEEVFNFFLPNFNDINLVKPLMFLNVIVVILFILIICEIKFEKLDLNY